MSTSTRGRPRARRRARARAPLLEHAVGQAQELRQRIGAADGAVEDVPLLAEVELQMHDVSNRNELSFNYYAASQHGCARDFVTPARGGKLAACTASRSPF